MVINAVKGYKQGKGSKEDIDEEKGIGEVFLFLNRPFWKVPIFDI